MGKRMIGFIASLLSGFAISVGLNCFNKKQSILKLSIIVCVPIFVIQFIYIALMNFEYDYISNLLAVNLLVVISCVVFVELINKFGVVKSFILFVLNNSLFKLLHYLTKLEFVIQLSHNYIITNLLPNVSDEKIRILIIILTLFLIFILFVKIILRLSILEVLVFLTSCQIFYDCLLVVQNNLLLKNQPIVLPHFTTSFFILSTYLCYMFYIRNRVN